MDINQNPGIPGMHPSSFFYSQLGDPTAYLSSHRDFNPYLCPLPTGKPERYYPRTCLSSLAIRAYADLGVLGEYVGNENRHFLGLRQHRVANIV